MAVPFNEPLLVTLLCLTSSLFFLSFYLFSPPPPPARELHGTWAKFLDTVRAYPFNHPVGDETSVEKERKFYPWREYLYFI